MFCKWCGERLDKNVSKCSCCGREQEMLEQGNFFGDLCADYKKNILSSYEKHDNAERVEGKIPSQKDNEGYRPRKRSVTSRWQVITSLVLICCSLVCIFGTYAVYSKLDRNTAGDNVSQNIIELRNKVNSNILLLSVRAQLEGSLSELEEKLDGIKDDIKLSEDTTDKVSEDVTDHEKTDKPYIGDFYGTEDIPDSDFIKDIDKLSLTEYVNSANEDSIIYKAEGELVQSGMCELYWQTSTDDGDSWSVAEKDLQYYETTSTNNLYRLICHHREQSIINWSDLGKCDDIYTINKSEVGNETFRIDLELKDDEYHFVWQISLNGIDWLDDCKTVSFYITESDSVHYRLLLYKDLYYCAYAPSETDDNKINNIADEKAEDTSNVTDNNAVNGHDKQKGSL